MKPRQRRAARRRAIRERLPVGKRIWVDASPDEYLYNEEHRKMFRLAVLMDRTQLFGEWFVYGFKGQSLRIRRAGMKSGYTATLKELHI